MYRNGYVYIMASKNNTVLYVGVTSNLPRRVYEHKTGLIEGFTKQYNIHKLVYAEKFDNIKAAILREKQLKGWSRAKKDALITAANPDWSELPPF